MCVGAPAALKQSYQSETLDDVFFDICKTADDEGEGDDQEETRPQSREKETEHEGELELLLSSPTTTAPASDFHCQSIGLLTVFGALLFKNLMVLRRHTMFMAFNVVMPVTSLIICLLAIGGPIHGLRLGVVNEEVGPGGCDARPNVTCPSALDLLTTGLDMGRGLSCHFLAHLDTYVFSSVTERSLEEAVEAVEQARDHAFIRFHEGFSEALADRMEATVTLSEISPESLDLSQIKVTADAANSEVFRALQVSVMRSTQAFFLWYADSCDLSKLRERVTSTGLEVRNVREGVEPVDNLAHGMLPGMIAVLLHMMAMALTADQLATEREDGLFERDFVAGIPVVLIMLSQVTVQLIVVLGQIGFSMALLCFVFPGLPPDHIAVLFVLYLLQSLCGMALGFFISAVFRRRSDVRKNTVKMKSLRLKIGRLRLNSNSITDCKFFYFQYLFKIEVGNW